jgi:hypothetical protein
MEGDLCYLQQSNLYCGPYQWTRGCTFVQYSYSLMQLDDAYSDVDRSATHWHRRAHAQSSERGHISQQPKSGVVSPADSGHKPGATERPLSRANLIRACACARGLS